MKRFGLVVCAVALVAAVPAWAAKPSRPFHPGHPSRSAHRGSGHNWGKKSNFGPGSRRGCRSWHDGFFASGTLVSASLTAGAKTGEYDGTITVDVTRTSDKGATGSQTFALTNAWVWFGHGLTSTTTAAGDRVFLRGKVTSSSQGGSTTGSTTTTVREVAITDPKQARQ